MRASGFTIIEALVAIALGIAVCGAAYGTARMAASSLTAIDRLAVQNRLLLAGASAALHELDSWASLDDPLDPSRQPLRTAPAGDARPFAAMAFDSPARSLVFDPSHPRSWFRSCPIFTAAHGFGDYSILARLGHPDPAREWYPRMIADLGATLGYYALLDYLPSNTYFHYYGVNGLTPWEVRETRVTPKAGELTHNNNIGGYAGTPRDLWAISAAAAFTVTTEPGYRAGGIHRRVLRARNLLTDADGKTVIDQGTRMAIPIPPAAEGGRFYTMDGGAISATADHPVAMPVKPMHWPRLEVRVSRLIASGRRVNAGKVLLTDPITGEATKMFFTATATTLRGARRNRGLDETAP
ncbi:MAG TPA: hypothetical protein VEL07_02385 [Planctomycetota bacterium]|nr:hypothetical protein [Planctomycetota bacterium]